MTGCVCNDNSQYGMCLLTLIYGLPEDIRRVSHMAYGTLKKDSWGKHFTSTQIRTTLNPQLTVM